MVIDKTTGRGCAWSIASKTVTKRLIAENIMDKLIFIKTRPSRFDLLRVVNYREDTYVMLQREHELSGEPLWTPSFIDTEIWGQAVSRFQSFEKLDRNVEKHLLPQMDEYLQNIPDTELASMTRDLLIEHGVIHSPIAQRAGDTYYFNENEVYTLDKASQLFPYEKRIKYSLFKVEYETCFNMRVWRKAVSKFQIGMTLNECINIFLKTELEQGAPQELSPVDRLVQYIAPPIFERVPENGNEATFDHIRMNVGLPSYQFSWKALQDEVKKYQREICQRVLQRLECDRHFKRYGVPINFLKVSDIILRRDFSIEFIFELKE